MCDDISPCDLRTVSRTDRSDSFERWSVAQSEARHPHYWYRIVCSKHGFVRNLGQGYRYGEARELAKLLTNTCSQARPREDSWTLALFLPERISPLIRDRQDVGDLAFVVHENNHTNRADGTLACYTSRQLLVTIEAVSGFGKIERVRSLSGLVLDNPTVIRCFAKDDLKMQQFNQHVYGKLADCTPHQAYDYLTSPSVLEETMELFAVNEIVRTPFNTKLAAVCMRKVGLPEGHRPPEIAVGHLEQQVTSILSSPTRISA